MNTYADEPASIASHVILASILLSLLGFGTLLAKYPLVPLWDMPAIGLVSGTLGGATLSLQESLAAGIARSRMTQGEIISLGTRSVLGAVFGFVALSILPSIQQQIIHIHGISSPAVWGIGVAAGLLSNPGTLVRLITKQTP